MDDGPVLGFKRRECRPISPLGASRTPPPLEVRIDELRKRSRLTRMRFPPISRGHGMGDVCHLSSSAPAAPGIELPTKLRSPLPLSVQAALPAKSQLRSSVARSL